MFAPLKRAVRAIFVDELHIQRDEQGLRIVLHDGAQSALPPLPAAERALQQAQALERAEVAAMRQELASVFDGMPGSRRALRNLAYVEAQLAEQGLALLDTVALNLLRQALHEIEDAVTNWSPPGLACLRSKIAVAVRERETKAQTNEHDARLSRAELPAPEVLESRSEQSGGDPEQRALLAAYGAVDVDLSRS